MLLDIGEITKREIIDTHRHEILLSSLEKVLLDERMIGLVVGSRRPTQLTTLIMSWIMSGSDHHMMTRGRCGQLFIILKPISPL